MLYSSVSMLPVLLTILLLTLEHTLRALSTMSNQPTQKGPEVTQCPGQPCQTLAEYLENKTWDYSSHAKVVIMPGHHRVTQSFLVIFAFNFTLLGGISDNHTLHDTRPILHVASIWFEAVIYLNLTGIIVIKSYELEKFPRAPLEFTNVLTLRISQIAVHSTRGGIDAINVFGNSVIEHSSFDTISSGSNIIFFTDCPLQEAVCRVLHVPLNSYHHNIDFQNCTFTNVGGGSIFVNLAIEHELNFFLFRLKYQILQNSRTTEEWHSTYYLGD